MLADAAQSGDLTTGEAISDAAVVMFGGIDTTDGMIANAVLHLLSDPGQLELVRVDPRLVLAAIEESLRLEPAAALLDRYATRDAAIGGAEIKAGDRVSISLAAANRDPAVFRDPDRFDIFRSNAGRHLAFAHGPHFCIGATLARAETRAALDALLAFPACAWTRPARRPHGAWSSASPRPCTSPGTPDRRRGTSTAGTIAAAMTPRWRTIMAAGTSAMAPKAHWGAGPYRSTLAPG